MAVSARNRAIIDMRKSGMGPRRIARLMDLSPGVVAGVLSRAGMTHDGRNGGWSEEFKRRVLRDLNNGSGCTAVARKWNLARTTVQSWACKAAGVA